MKKNNGYSKRKVWLANKYIKWVNKFTFLKGDGINTIRRLEKKNKSKAEELYEKTRPPKDNTIDYLYFRLFDVFQIEDFENLIQGIKRLFPDFEDDFLFGNRDLEFIRKATGISGGHRLNIGTLYRDAEGMVFGYRARKMIELPEYVDFIDVELHKCLPSIFVMTYDVVLRNTATEKLIQLQNTYYYPEIQFRNLLPRGKSAGGYSTAFAEHVMRREIVKWLDTLRYQVEKILKSYLKGDFMLEVSEHITKLPAIEVYGFKNAPKTKTAQKNWLIATKDWLESFGFPRHHYDTYTNGKIMFLSIEKEEFFSTTIIDRSVHRLMVMWKSYIGTINTNMYGNNESYAIVHSTQELLTAMLPAIVLLEIISRFQHKFEKIRRDVLSNIKPRNIFGLYLLNYIKLSNDVFQASILYDRISKDFKQEQEYISRQLSEISDFKQIDLAGSNISNQLDDGLLKEVKFRIGFLEEHVTFISNWISQFLSLRNLSVTYLLAVVAGITAFLGLVLSIIGLRNP